MLYMALLFSEAPDEPQTPEDMAPWFEFGAAAEAADVLRGGDALHPAETATQVRLRDDEVLLTDGPFIDAKEQLNGYYLLECETLDEALKWAAKIPSAAYGTVEVRPVMKFD